jgi:WD40 repeat protein
VQTNQCIKTLEAQSVNCVQLLGDTTVFYGTEEGYVHSIDISTGKVISSFEGHTQSVNCMTLLSPGRLLTGRYDTRLLTGTNRRLSDCRISRSQTVEVQAHTSITRHQAELEMIHLLPSTCLDTTSIIIYFLQTWGAYRSTISRIMLCAAETAQFVCGTSRRASACERSGRTHTLSIA